MHFIDTMIKVKKVKEEYLSGITIATLSRQYEVDYVTLWRWLQIAGITKKEKRLHQLRSAERQLHEAQEWIDEHDCHKHPKGEDGCDCDAMAEKIVSLQRNIEAMKGGE